MSDRDRVATWLGWPVWGLTVAAIFLSYNALGASSAKLPWGLAGWLWVPWVGLGAAANEAIARKLGAEGFDVGDRSDWLSTLAGTGVFLAVDGVVGLAPAPTGPNAVNLVSVGGVAAGLAVLQRLRVGVRAAPGLLVGGGLVAGAYALPGLAGAEVLRGLVAALAGAVGFSLVGVAGLALEP